MVFIDNALGVQLPKLLDDHAYRTFKMPVKYEKNIIVIDIDGAYVVHGSWFKHNIYKHEESHG